jgi:hypothetical protein
MGKGDKMDEKDAVAVREDSLLTKAIEKGFDTQTIKDLIDLRNKEIARQAKAEFDLHFAEMQAEFRPVGKSSSALDRDGNKLYAYCPIEVILAMAAPIMARHGFSYRWTEEALENKEKRINCIISGYGHSETGFVDIPFMEPSTRATNIVQMRGSATTYGKRYSFLNATGIIVGGEDNDALSNSAPGSVKVEIVDDDAPDQHGEMHGAARSVAPAAKSNDPLDEARNSIKSEITRFVELSSSAYEGVSYFTEAEKVDFKAKIAAVNEGAKAEVVLAKGLEIKLKDLQTLNAAISEELEKRKGNTPLAQAMKEALAEKKVGPQQELGDIAEKGQTF